MADTKKPTNVKLSFVDLNGTTVKLKAEWTRAEDYKDQQLKLWIENKNALWEEVKSVGNSVNSKEFTTDFVPEWTWSFRDLPYLKLTVLVRGRAKHKVKKKQGNKTVTVEEWKSWSSWSKKEIALNEPELVKDPTVAHTNERTVTFSYAKKTDTKAPIFGYDYYLGSVTNYGGAGRPNWKSRWSPKHANYNVTSRSLTIPSYPEVGDHVTVFFAVRAYGARGTGNWHYGHQVLGTPDPPTSWSFTASKTSGNAMTLSYELRYPWSTYGSRYTKVNYEYCIANPTFNKTTIGQTAVYSITEPSGLSYTLAVDSTDIGDVGRGNAQVSASVGVDNVIFGRIQLINFDDNHPRITQGVPRASGSHHNSAAAYGDLSTPTYTSIVYNDGTETVTVSGVSTTSPVTDSYTVVIAKSAKGKSAIIGRLDHEETTKSCKVPSSVLDGSALSFGIQSFVANYTPLTPSATTATTYSLTNILMQSDINWKDGLVPGKPTLTLENVSTASEGGRIRVSWGAWPIGMAKIVLEYTSASDGWYDKSAISSVEINVSDSINTETIISGLDYASDSFSGIYYFRARYVAEANEVYGHYSDVATLGQPLSAAAPPKPELQIDPAIVPVDMPFDLYWAYSVGDKSTQRECSVYEVYINNGTITYSSQPIASATTEQRISLIPANLGWAQDTNHYLAISTLSSYGKWSEMSEYKQIDVAKAITLNVTLGTGFSEVTDPETQETHIELTQFPFTVSVSDADGTSVSLVISETDSMLKTNPDETEDYIFANDVVYAGSITIDEQTGSGSLTMTRDNFPSVLMHKREYHLSIFNEDGYGQRHTYDTDFIVDWDHPATIPSAGIIFNSADGTVSITPIGNPEEGSDAPDSGILEGDTCDIYRQSIDGWTKICSGGEFGETYIDPYPTLGDFGGYRIVFVSKYGDDNDANGTVAWYTYEYEEGDWTGEFETIIAFGNYSIHLPYNLTFSRSWDKDFIETKYLGGSVQGDWNSAVSHSISMSTSVPIEYDSELYRDMHRLAMYPGVCRVRTPDGSNIWANVEVKEDKEEKWVNRLAKFSLEITRVDAEQTNEVVVAE